jgi:hypothetical protein
LQWQPELSLKILKAPFGGKAFNEATHHYLQQQLVNNKALRAIAQLMESVLLADIKQTMPALIARIYGFIGTK